MAILNASDGLSIVVRPVVGSKLNLSIATYHDAINVRLTPDEARTLALMLSAEADNLGPSANMYRPENRPIKSNPEVA